ncbi:hypothetical protein ACS0TY_012542 [Phlomoides rotata]
MSWTAGRVVYYRPVRFWESSPARQASFETTIKFLITPSQNGAADGLAFFIAPVNTTIPSGTNGANLGIFGSTGLLPPSLQSNSTTLSTGLETQIIITLESTSNLERPETLRALIVPQGNWTILPNQVQVGISAATGQTVSALGVHDVISWYFTSFLVYTNVNNNEKAYIRKYMGMY